MNESDGGGPNRGPCVTELLQDEHDAMRALFARLDDGGPPERKQYLLDEIEALFLEHSRVEELVLEQVGDLPGVTAMLATAGKGDREMCDSLRLLARMIPWARDYDQQVGDLVRRMRAHLAWEEEHLFPSLRRALPEEERRRLGLQAERPGRRAA